MRITTGLASVAVAAPVAGRPSPSCRGFRSRTRITACWLVARHCGGALWSTTPGNRPRLLSKTQTACPILPRSAAGPRPGTPPQPAASFRQTLARRSIGGHLADQASPSFSWLTPVLQILTCVSEKMFPPTRSLESWRPSPRLVSEAKQRRGRIAAKLAKTAALLLQKILDPACQGHCLSLSDSVLCTRKLAFAPLLCQQLQNLLSYCHGCGKQAAPKSSCSTPSFFPLSLRHSQQQVLLQPTAAGSSKRHHQQQTRSTPRLSNHRGLHDRSASDPRPADRRRPGVSCAAIHRPRLFFRSPEYPPAQRRAGRWCTPSQHCAAIVNFPQPMCRTRSRFPPGPSNSARVGFTGVTFRGDSRRGGCLTMP
jgi:hypothetical protein